VVLGDHNVPGALQCRLEPVKEPGDNGHGEESPHIGLSARRSPENVPKTISMLSVMQIELDFGSKCCGWMYNDPKLIIRALICRFDFILCKSRFQPVHTTLLCKISHVSHATANAGWQVSITVTFYYQRAVATEQRSSVSERRATHVPVAPASGNCLLKCVVTYTFGAR